MGVAYMEAEMAVEEAVAVAAESSAASSVVGLLGTFFPLIMMSLIVVPAILIPILVSSSRRKAAAKAAQAQQVLEVPGERVVIQPVPAQEDALAGLNEEQLRQVQDYARFLKEQGK